MITKIRSDVHQRCLSFRALDRLVNSPAFEEACLLDPGNVWVQFALINGDAEAIEEWIEKTLTKEVGEMSLRELREKAARLRIPNYTSYNKESLLILIVQHDRQTSKAPIRMQA